MKRVEVVLLPGEVGLLISPTGREEDLRLVGVWEGLALEEVLRELRVLLGRSGSAVVCVLEVCREC